MKKKVLFLIKVPPPVTGATVMNERIYKSSSIRDSFYTDFIRVSYLRDRDDFGIFSVRKLVAIVNTIAAILKKLITNKPDLFYFQVTPNGVGFVRDSIYILLVNLFKVPIVLHMRGKWVTSSINSYWRRKYYEFILRYTSLICHSDIVSKAFTHVFKGPYHVVENGIPVDVTEDQILHKSDSDIPKLIYLSTLMKNKGIFDFVEALGILKRENLRFEAIIIGEAKNDNTLAKLRKLIDEKGLSESVLILGSKFGEEKFTHLVDSDIFIFPTLFEAFGNVVLEAFQAQLPVVATKEGSLPIIIDNGVDGLLYEKGNVHELSKKIKKLILNPDLRRSMGKKGRKKFLERYTFQNFEVRMTNTLNRIIESNGADF